jgi:hypothetical protein
LSLCTLVWFASSFGLEWILKIKMQVTELKTAKR